MSFRICKRIFDIWNDTSSISYSTGVYIRSSDQFLGGHAVKFIGWGTENGVDYWLVANSWGGYIHLVDLIDHYSQWGEQGLFKIRRETDECAIEDEIATGIPKLK